MHLRPAQIVAFAKQRSVGPARMPTQSRAAGIDALSIPEGYIAPGAEGVLDDDGVRLVGQPAHDPLRFGWSGDGDPLWMYTLHYHGWLSAPQCDVDLGRATILDWIEEHRSGVGWEPYPTSMRLLHWIGWLAQHGGSLHAAQLETVLASMSAQLQHLAAHIEVHIDGNHLWTNAVALAAGSLALVGPVPSRLQEDAATRLLAIVRDQVASDGVHGERTPTYHCLLAEQLAQVVVLAEPRMPGLADPLRLVAERMVTATAAFTHPDGDVALWGDSQLGAPVTPRTLARRFERGLVTDDATCAPSGLARRVWGPFTLLWNRGGVGLPYQVGHIHADCLALEVSVGTTRVLVDGGVGTYVEGDERSYSRSTAAHNTVTVGGRDQHELWKSHRIGGRAIVHDVVYGDERLAGEVQGFRSNTVHRRDVRRAKDGFVVTDALVGDERGVLRWFVPEALPLRATQDGALVFLPRGGAVELRITGGAVEIEPAPGWTAMGVAAPRRCLRVAVGSQPVITTIRTVG
jgi:uncharacterized heparinase superfamily protein